jgi:hypothetical protein
MANTRTAALLFVAVTVASAIACGNDGPPPYGAFPGALCQSDLDCGGGSYCVDTGGGTCQPPCRNNVDCGPGYSCKSQNRRGAGGKVDVCLPN